MTISLIEPNLTDKELLYAARAITNGHVGPNGSYVEQFEHLVAEASQRDWAVAVTTGTAALHVAAHVLWGHRIKIVVQVYRYALPAARNALSLVCHSLPCRDGGYDHDYAEYIPKGGGRTLADRAPAIGEARSHCDLECYSFAANKIVTCGQGGAIVGDNRMMEERVRKAIHQGYNRNGVFNYRMANINAAVGCAQMERLKELKKIKYTIWNTYKEAGLKIIDRGPSRWICTIEGDDKLVEYLTIHDIESRLEPCGVSIPCGTKLTNDEQMKVIQVVKDFYHDV